VKDVVDAYIALADAPRRDGIEGEAFNFSPQSRYTVMDIVVALGRVMNVEPNPLVLATATMEIRDQTLDATKAREQLGWKPQWSLDEGLRETVAWYTTYLTP